MWVSFGRLFTGAGRAILAGSCVWLVALPAHSEEPVPGQMTDATFFCVTVENLRAVASTVSLSEIEGLLNGGQTLRIAAGQVDFLLTERLSGGPWRVTVNHKDYLMADRLLRVTPDRECLADLEEQEQQDRQRRLGAAMRGETLPPPEFRFCTPDIAPFEAWEPALMDVDFVAERLKFDSWTLTLVHSTLRSSNRVEVVTDYTCIRAD